MLSNFLKVIFRQIVRSRFFALINICGLAIGIASSIVIYHYVRHELSYDQFHQDKDIIYRVIRQSTMNEMPYPIGITSAPFAPALMNDYGDKIQAVTRALSINSLITYEDKSFIEEKLMFADKNFFSFFSFPLRQGDPSTVLDHPNAVAITRSFALKYFGEDDPIGKTLRMDNEYDLVVTGIIDALPGHTHLQFDLVGSLEISAHEEWHSEWWDNCLNTYVKVPRTKDAEYLNGVFPQFMEKYFGEDFERVGNRIGLSLEPLQDIYFNNDTRYEQGVVHGDKKYVYIFGSVGLLLILLAAINYMNLATAQASKRAKEVGIRKTLGSQKLKIAAQFFTESFILCVFAVLLALIIVQAAVPFLRSSFGLSTAHIFTDHHLWLFLAGVILIITFLSASYPSILLASFQPAKVLKGEIHGSVEYLVLRKVLVIFQFGVSVCMIIATLMISRQLQFLQHKDLGFDRNHVLRIRMNNPEMKKYAESFKHEVLKRNDVQSASYMSDYPGGYYDATTVHVEGTDLKMRMRTLWADEDFAKVLALDFIAGRSFSKAYPSDKTASVIINETAVRQLGWLPVQAIGNRVILSQFDSTYKYIIGVVKDYHFTSLKEKVEPLIISHDEGDEMLIKLSGTGSHNTIAAIEKIWASYNTGFPMVWSFLDKTVNQLYQQEILQGRLFTVFSFLSVFIACLGILGLTAYLTTQRQKEIGIRKVLGADTFELSLLLMKDTLLLVLIANVLAIPAGYYAINSWLSGFAYRTSFTPSIFITGGLTVFVIAIMVVGSRVLGTAMENPVKALRSE